MWPDRTVPPKQRERGEGKLGEGITDSQMTGGRVARRGGGRGSFVVFIEVEECCKHGNDQVYQVHSGSGCFTGPVTWTQGW